MIIQTLIEKFKLIIVQELIIKQADRERVLVEVSNKSKNSNIGALIILNKEDVVLLANELIRLSKKMK